LNRFIGPVQAGLDLGLSYRRAWLLIDDLNNCFRHPVIEAKIGGIAGGGTTLTQFGRKLVERYHAIEADALAATQKHLRDLEGALASTKRASLPPPPMKINFLAEIQFPLGLYRMDSPTFKVAY
jgi:molybdate transport repressor ModE-like protein